MTDKKSLTFCIDWMRGRAEHTPMPTSRATMESIVDYLEELESLQETLDMYGGWDGIDAVYQKLEDLRTPDPQADRPRTNSDVIRAMSDEELVKFLGRGKKPWCLGLNCNSEDACAKCIDEWLKQEAH